jgi:hypothetical protein
MSQTHMPSAMRRLVEQRAVYRCEYCLLLADISLFPHEVDHVIAEKHGGVTNPDNLAYTCWRCNRRKGTDLGSFDPQTGSFSMLFNPRTQIWYEHFVIEDDLIIGFTPEGRTTVAFLQLNSDARLAERRRLRRQISADL